jgi:hypothetical protein
MVLYIGKIRFCILLEVHGTIGHSWQHCSARWWYNERQQHGQHLEPNNQSNKADCKSHFWVNENQPRSRLNLQSTTTPETTTFVYQKTTLSRNLPNQLSPHPSLLTTNKDSSNRPLDPLLRHTNAVPILVADKTNEKRIGFLALGIGGCVSGYGVEVSATSIGFGGLLFEELVDRFHLVDVRSDREREWERNTFSSSFRFSERFFLRRAISARRIACSSAVKCFLTWTSVGRLVHIM